MNKLASLGGRTDQNRVICTTQATLSQGFCSGSARSTFSELGGGRPNTTHYRGGETNSLFAYNV